MKKLLLVMATIALLAGFCLAGCSHSTTIPGADGANGVDGADGADGKSAYELFVEENPWYEGNKAQWLDDLVSGKLAMKKDYSILSYGRNLAAILENDGSVSYNTPTATQSASVSLNIIVTVGLFVCPLYKFCKVESGKPASFASL